MIREGNTQDDSSDEDIWYVYTLRAVSNKPRRTKLPRMIAKVNGTKTEFIIDTGAGLNILDKNGFDNLRDKPKLDRTDIRVRAYKFEQPITILGKFCAQVQVQERETQATFYVTDGHDGSLLTCENAEALKLVRELMKKDTEWQWEKPQEDAFNLLKLREDTVTQYYDPKKTTEIIVDASPVGLGAILVQDTKDERFVISYASRALTPVEQRYSQTKREALAVVFGCERYHLYVMGSRFTVVTDHKPLVSIYNNPQSNPPARIERWTLRLQRYDMTVVYRPGKDNPADYLSRHPDPHPKAYRAEMEGEEYVNFVAINAVPKAITFEEVQEETLKDEVLQQVASAIERNKWDHLLDKKSPDNNAFKSFYKVRSELTIAHDRSYVLRGTRLVMPFALQTRAIDLAHEGHQGLVKSKQLIRTKVGFLGSTKR